MISRLFTHALALVATAGLTATLGSCGDGRDIVVGEDYRTVLEPLQHPTTALDVLFVVDTSGSIQVEQAGLVAAAGDQLFAQLETDLGATPDLHVAVTSTDVDVGQSDIGGCEVTDDGRFRVGARGATCPIDGTYLVDESDGAGGRTTNYQGSLVDAFACAATLGTEGCGYEQPLEAMRRALDGRYPEHAGFLRQDALLLIVFITDEDDCSAFDTSVFGSPLADPTSPLGPRTSFRCFEFGTVCDPDQPRAFGDKSGCRPREDSAYITPPGEFAAFLRALKSDPATVMLAGMYGDPEPVTVMPDLMGQSGAILSPACFSLQTGVEATPAIRLDALTREFPSRFVFQSLCEATMSERLYRVTRAATGVMSQRPCLLGEVRADTVTERCRAFDVAVDSRRAVDRCTGAGADCFEIVTSAQCDYTPSQLAASYRGTLADGHRLVVECLAPTE